jgi:hypothetical protein
MKPLLAAKLAIVLVLIVGTFVLVALGKVSFPDAVRGTSMLASALVVALGLHGAAVTMKGPPAAEQKETDDGS